MEITHCHLKMSPNVRRSLCHLIQPFSSVARPIATKCTCSWDMLLPNSQSMTYGIGNLATSWFTVHPCDQVAALADCGSPRWLHWTFGGPNKKKRVNIRCWLCTIYTYYSYTTSNYQYYDSCKCCIVYVYIYSLFRNGSMFQTLFIYIYVYTLCMECVCTCTYYGMWHECTIVYLPQDWFSRWFLKRLMPRANA